MSDESPILRPTIANLVEDYKKHAFHRFALGTQGICERELRRFALFVGRREMSGRVIHEFMDERFKKTAGGSGETLMITIQWVGKFLKWCEEIGEFDHRYSSLLQRVPVTHKPPLRFSQDQYERLKEVTKGTPWHYASIMAYRTGARKSDVFMLKWEHVDFENLVVRYVPYKSRKTGRYATCPFQAGGDLHEVLKELNRARDPRPHWDQFVCAELAMRYPVHGRGGDVETRDFKKFCAAIGAGRLTFHCLRHSFISRLVNVGTAFPMACQITGLAGTEIFLRYAKPDIPTLRAAIEKADALDDIPPAGDNIIQLPAA